MNPTFFWMLFAFVSGLITPVPALAVPPPDFIFSVTTQVIQFFTVGVIFLSALASGGFRVFSASIHKLKHPAFLYAGTAVLVLAAAFGGAKLYGILAQQQALSAWLASSAQRTQQTISGTSNIESQLMTSSSQPETFVVTPHAGTSTSPAPTPIPVADPGEQLIRTYYQNIATHHFAEAYAVSKQTVSLNVFEGWYASTTAITITDLRNIDGTSYSLSLTLTEGSKDTQYAVLMTLGFNAARQPVRIDKSVVHELGITIRQAAGQAPAPILPVATSSSVPLMITNAEFRQLSSSPAMSQAIVLDAREDEEFRYGHYPNAQHVRAADLYAGRWVEFVSQPRVIVFCWSGIRGKQVATFLQQHGVNASYVENGASGWVQSGGTWQGDYLFGNIHTEDRYRIVLSTDDVKKAVADGAFLVDSREPDRFQIKHIAGSVNVPLFFTPTTDLSRVLSQVPAGKKVITICDDYVNCFDAKLTGLALEQLGHDFLGRYATPYEWTTP